MINTNYANAYKEVLIVLNNLIKEDYEKIPKEYIKFFETNANPDYEFKYDASKVFEEQELLDDTKYILFGLFEKFWSTEAQKLKIKVFKNNYDEKLNKEKKEKYNQDDIFKKNNLKENIINETKESVQIVEYIKQKWYQKIFEKIRKRLKNRNID